MNKKLYLKVVVAMVIILLCVFGFFCILSGISQLKDDNQNLQQQVDELTLENQVLQHNYDMIKDVPTVENSSELEVLNTIGQAIANSKSVDLTIDTDNGKIHFMYEAK